MNERFHDLLQELKDFVGENIDRPGDDYTDDAAFRWNDQKDALDKVTKSVVSEKASYAGASAAAAVLLADLQLILDHHDKAEAFGWDAA